jgi:hypothetical protein
VGRVSLSSLAVVAALALTTSPAAAPTRHAAAVTLKKTSFSVSWSESHFRSGRLVLVGSAKSPMTLNFGWFARTLLGQKRPRYGASGPVTGHVSVKKGKFRKTIKFTAALYPGQFVLMGYAKGGAGVVSFPGRYLKMPAPPEGIVVRAKGHSTGRTAVFANFTFVSNGLPRSRSVNAHWFQPNGKLLGSKTKPAGQTFVTAVKSTGAPLATGFWRCVLYSANRPISQVSVRVG